MLAIGLVAVVAILGGAVIIASSRSGANASASKAGASAGFSAGVAISSSGPIATIPAVPTEAPTIQATTGTLSGSVISASGATTSGVGVILCLRSTAGCLTDETLGAVTDVMGRFEIDAVPAGSYVVLYSMTGAPSARAAELTIALTSDTASCLGQAMMGTAPSMCRDSIPFIDDTGAQILKGASVSVTSSGFSFEEGVVYSPKYGLYLNFAGGEPLGAEVTGGGMETVEINID
jgi:hypothetical protein